MSFFLIKPCKSTAAFEAVPQDQVKLDLESLIPKLSSSGFQIITDAGVLLVVEKDGCEISIYPTGKLLLKIDEIYAAEKLAAELEEILFQ